MSTAAVSSSSVQQDLRTYYQQRGSDLQQLGQALQSGNVSGAQQEFNAIQTLGQSGPFSSGNAFAINQREQDFNAIGQALQSGDLNGAQQAFNQLESSLHQGQRATDPPPVVVNLSAAATAASSTASTTASSTAAANSTASASGSEIVINLGNITQGEQINIGVSNSSNGGEQVTIGVTQPNQNPEQITLNLNQNSNQEIILNLLNNAASTTNAAGSTASGSNLNVSA
jgi:hypothetical protein